MDLNVETAGDVAVLVLPCDSLDAACSEEVKARLGYLATEHRKLVVDMTRVRFMDSGGCGALVAGMMRFRAAGGDLRLGGVTVPVRTVLEIARLTRTMGVFDTRDKAVASFSGG